MTGDAHKSRAETAAFVAAVSKACRAGRGTTLAVIVA
jgi:hypothetical protein